MRYQICIVMKKVGINMNPYQVLGVSQTDDEDIIKRHTEKRQKNATPILIREIKEQRNGLRKSERHTGFSVINKKKRV